LHRLLHGVFIVLHTIKNTRLAACTGLVLLAALSARAELVTNGSFEADALSPSNLGGSLGLQTIPMGWSALRGGQNVDLIGNGYFGGSASHGTVFLDLIGNGTGSLPSGVRQAVNLLSGVSYRLSFDYNGGAPLTVVDSLLQWALGDLDHGSIDVDALNVFSGNRRPVTPWGHFSRDIAVATGGSYWLSFSTPYGDSGGPYLDNVSLIALTPTQQVDEPGALSLAAGALVLLGAARRVAGRKQG
jgi:hypothetical protein